MAKPKESLSHFDADALSAAQEVPTLMVDRFLYRGRLLSIEEWLPFWDRLQAMDARPAAADDAEARTRLRERAVFHRDYLRAVFPKRDFRFWAPDPVKHALRKPLQEVEAIVAFFFILQTHATFGKEAIGSATAPTPSGTSSKPQASAMPVGVARE